MDSEMREGRFFQWIKARKSCLLLCIEVLIFSQRRLLTQISESQQLTVSEEDPAGHGRGPLDQKRGSPWEPFNLRKI